MKLSALHPLLLLFGLIYSASAQQTGRVIPYEPAPLLATLPNPPADWILIRSDAETFLGESIATKATRIFQAPPSPTSSTATDQLPPGEVEISVVDTGGFAPALADFLDFKPLKAGTVEKKFIASIPAIVFSNDENHQFTQLLVASRYLLEITFTNLPQQRVEDWLRTFHFDQLPPRHGSPADASHEFRLSHLDELHPEKSRSYTVNTTDRKQLEKILHDSAPVDPAR